MLMTNVQRSVIIAELWRPEVAEPGNFDKQFLRFFGKRSLMLKFSKFCSERFHHLTIDVGVEMS